MSEQDKLVEVLLSARSDANEGYMTIRELMRVTGKSNDRLRGRLRELIDCGEVEVKGVCRVNIAGYVQTIPGYRLVNDNKD